MNKNLINYKVYRTKEATIFECICALLLLLSFILSIVQIFTNPRQGGLMLLSSIVFGMCIFLMLVLVYRPETFNIPDNSNARMFEITVRFIRLMSLITSMLALGLAVMPFVHYGTEVPIIAYGIIAIIFIIWYFVAMRRARHLSLDNK